MTELGLLGMSMGFSGILLIWFGLRRARRRRFRNEPLILCSACKRWIPERQLRDYGLNWYHGKTMCGPVWTDQRSTRNELQDGLNSDSEGTT